MWSRVVWGTVSRAVTRLSVVVRSRAHTICGSTGAAAWTVKRNPVPVSSTETVSG